MLLEKVIDATVNVRNPIDFCADKPRHLLADLRNTYVGRCFKGAYIVRIESILRSSACHLSTTNTSGEGYIDVQFLAKVIVFSRWDILVGVEVASHQQLLIGTYKATAGPSIAKAEAVVTVLASKLVEPIAVGQRIPVRVLMAEHQPMQTQAALIGTLLTCDQLAPVYRLQGDLDPSARADFASLLAEIEIELGARAELVRTRKADLWFFELLLYSYRADSPPATDQSVPSWAGAPDWEGPEHLVPAEIPGAKSMNILEMAHQVIQGETIQMTGLWVRPTTLYRSSPLAIMATELPPEWMSAVTSGTPRAVFVLFLKNILDFLVATREMAELYNTRQLMDSHYSLWAAMRSVQKPVSANLAD